MSRMPSFRARFPGFVCGFRPGRCGMRTVFVARPSGLRGRGKVVFCDREGVPSPCRRTSGVGVAFRRVCQR